MCFGPIRLPSIRRSRSAAASSACRRESISIPDIGTAWQSQNAGSYLALRMAASSGTERPMSRHAFRSVTALYEFAQSIAIGLGASARVALIHFTIAARLFTFVAPAASGHAHLLAGAPLQTFEKFANSSALPYIHSIEKKAAWRNPRSLKCAAASLHASGTSMTQDGMFFSILLCARFTAGMPRRFSDFTYREITG